MLVDTTSIGSLHVLTQAQCMTAYNKATVKLGNYPHPNMFNDEDKRNTGHFLHQWVGHINFNILKTVKKVKAQSKI